MKFKKVLAMAISTVILFSAAGCTPKAANPAPSPSAATTEATPAPSATTAEGATPAPSQDATHAEVQQQAAQFLPATTNDKPGVEGGTLNLALVDDSNFAGILNICFYEDNYDSQILEWFYEGVVSYDENFVMDQDGAATYTYDKDAKTITLTMKPNVKWHDGQPVTLDDLVYAYEVIANPEYKGLRYDENVTNVVGVEEFHDGKAKTISGLKLSDDKMTLVMQFKEFYPSILVGGFWANPIPRHYYGDIAVKDMAADPKSRLTPMGFGPFKVKSTVPGESVTLERFDDYYKGKPKLAGVNISVIKPELLPVAMQEGKFDVAENFSTQSYPDYKDPTNYTYLAEVQTVFGYTGFKLGKWDATANKSVVNPDSKMYNLKLRQAIAYAIDNKTIGQTLYNGLRFLATTVITPRHASYQNKEMTGYVYDPEKAKQLLDEAGYKDVDNDGYREDPAGKPFVITWAAMDGQGADTLSQFKIQQWKEVGLKVELYNGRLTEFNAFYDAIEMDDPAIDMYDAAWNTGFNPNPSELWGPTTSSNYTRYTSDTFNAMFADVASDKAWDDAFRTERYHTWQTMFFDEAPAIPTLWRMGLTAVNNRVKNYTVESPDITMNYHLIELTADKPEVK